MANVLAWSLFVLGVAHILFGVKRFKAQLAAVVAAGFVGQFSVSEDRRTAFWFLLVGPLLMMAGQVAVHAVATGDMWTFRLLGIYLLVTSSIGVTAFPKSPLWAPFFLSLPFIAVGYGFF